MNEKEWDEYIDDNENEKFSNECSRITRLFEEADRKQKYGERI